MTCSCFFLNVSSSSIDKDAAFIVSQPREESERNSVQESLLWLLNQSENNQASPMSLNSRILDQSKVLIKEFRVVKTQKFVPSSAGGDTKYPFAVEFHTVKRKGVSVNVVWNKPLKELTKDNILNVARTVREWMYLAKSFVTIEELMQRNRTLEQDLKLAQKPRGTTGPTNNKKKAQIYQVKNRNKNRNKNNRVKNKRKL